MPNQTLFPASWHVTFCMHLQAPPQSEQCWPALARSQVSSTPFSSSTACAALHRAASSCKSTTHAHPCPDPSMLCSNPAFETDTADDLKPKRTSSDWGSVSLSRAGSPIKDLTQISAKGFTQRSSDDSGGSWLRPAATSAFHSRTGSVLSDWADSEGVGIRHAQHA